MRSRPISTMAGFQGSKGYLIAKFECGTCGSCLITGEKCTELERAGFGCGCSGLGYGGLMKLEGQGLNTILAFILGFN